MKRFEANIGSFVGTIVMATAANKYGLSAVIGTTAAGATSFWGGIAVAAYFFSRGVYWNNNENTLKEIRGCI